MVLLENFRSTRLSRNAPQYRSKQRRGTQSHSCHSPQIQKLGFTKCILWSFLIKITKVDVFSSPQFLITFLIFFLRWPSTFRTKFNCKEKARYEFRPLVWRFCALARIESLFIVPDETQTKFCIRLQYRIDWPCYGKIWYDLHGMWEAACHHLLSLRTACPINHHFLRDARHLRAGELLHHKYSKLTFPQCEQTW